MDTVKVEADKSTLLTDGIKSVKDTQFFLDSESDVQEVKKTKKPPVAPLKNGSPLKAKVIGGKTLRNQGRRQDEVQQTALAKLMEHQRELHDRLQNDGLAKFSEDGAGTSSKEGKGWKKFQSYKGEGALPPDVEKLRVCACLYPTNTTLTIPPSGLCGPQDSNSCSSDSWICRPFPHQHDQERKQE